MIKTKLLVGLATMVATLIASAAPASAWFESNSASSKGPIKTFPASSTFQGTQEGPKVECKATNKEGVVVAEGEWEIQVKAANTAGFQAATKSGPHEQLKIKKWGVCTGPTGIAAQVKCSLQVEQPNKNPNKPQVATGSVYPLGCQVMIGTANNYCAIAVETTGNKELKEVKLENIGTNEVGIKGEVEGITSSVRENGTLCKTLKLEGGKEGHFKTNNENLVTEGQKLI